MFRSMFRSIFWCSTPVKKSSERSRYGSAFPVGIARYTCLIWYARKGRKSWLHVRASCGITLRICPRKNMARLQRLTGSKVYLWKWFFSLLFDDQQSTNLIVWWFEQNHTRTHTHSLGIGLALPYIPYTYVQTVKANNVMRLHTCTFTYTRTYVYVPRRDDRIARALAS